MNGVGEMADVDGPHGHADNRDNLGQLLTELIKFLSERSLHVVTLVRDGLVDLTCELEYHQQTFIFY